MERLVVRLLGEPSVQFDGRPVSLRVPPRAFTILALLSLRRLQPLSRVAAAAMLWPDAEDAGARANLRRHLHMLLTALPGNDELQWIGKDGGNLSWREGAPVWVDINAFEDGVADPERRAQALDLYRGPLLDAMRDVPLAYDRDRLETLCINACREEALSARSRLDFATAIAYADRILAMDEWREDALRLGMALRYESGDRSSALAQFERFAQRLGSEMGVDPMPETLAARDAVLMNSASPQIADLASAHTPPPDKVPRTLFVGRSREMADLVAAWQRAAGGSGSTVFLSGEAGIGKSRLVAELASFVAAQGGRVLIGETSNPERLPYEPYVDALRRGLALIAESPVGQPWLSALTELLPELHATFPDLPKAEPFERDQARDRLYQSIARTIERLAAVRPLLLVLEDVHWSQTATLEVTQMLARRVGGVPLLFVVTYRSGDRSDGNVASLRRSLQIEGRATSIEPQALERRDVDALVQGLPALDYAAAFAETVFVASEGNPLFVAQLVQRYTETGRLLPEAAAATIAQVIGSRLETLDEQASTLAQVAATMGTSFTIDVAASILGWRQGAALDAIGTLIARSLVRATGRSAFSYSFSHALIANTIYAAIPAEQRVIWHHRIASVLAASASSDRSDLASIARHWQAGGELERAGQAFTLAAEAALAQYAPTEAVALSRSALELLPEPADRFRILHAIAKASAALVSSQTRHDDLLALSQAAERLGPNEQFMALQEWAEYYFVRGDTEGLRVNVASMLELSRDLAPVTRSLAKYALGAFRKYQWQFDEAIEPLRESLELAIEANDAYTECHARSLLGTVYSFVGQDAEAREQIEALRVRTQSHPPLEYLYWYAQMDLALQLPDPPMAKSVGEAMLVLSKRREDRWIELNARILIVSSAEWLSSAAETRHLHDSLIAFCSELSERVLAVGTLNRAAYELTLGCAEAAMRMTHDLLPALERLADSRLLSQAYAIRAESFTLVGDAPAAVEAGKQGAAHADSLGGVTKAVADAAFAAALCAAGDRERGLSAFARAIEATQTGHVSRRIDVLAQYLLALNDAGLRDESARIAAQLSELHGRRGQRLWLRHPGRVMYALARTAKAMGKPDKAAAYVARGTLALEKDIDRLGEEIRGPLIALPFNRLLLES